jgi:ABC-type sugar transport system ATPase subunit
VPDTNFVQGRLEALDGVVRFVAGEWSVALDSRATARVKPYLQRSVVLAVRPEDVRLGAADETGGVAARIVEVQPLSGVALVRVGERGGVSPLVGKEVEAASATLMSRTSARVRMAAGDLVSMHLDMRQANVFDPATGENLGWPRVVEGN